MIYWLAPCCDILKLQKYVSLRFRVILLPVVKCGYVASCSTVYLDTYVIYIYIYPMHTYMFIYTFMYIICVCVCAHLYVEHTLADKLCYHAIPTVGDSHTRLFKIMCHFNVNFCRNSIPATVDYWRAFLSNFDNQGVRFTMSLATRCNTIFFRYLSFILYIDR